MLDTQTLREAFKRKRYGAGEYDPDFDLFDAAADEIERLRKIEAAALLWRAGLEDDGWSKEDIESGICRNGIAELMMLLNQQQPRISDAER